MEKNEKLKCIKCNTVKNLDLFNKPSRLSKKGIPIYHSVCKECFRKNAIIKRYKDNYGIVLDYELLFDTFDIITWYHWTFNKFTPNGKLIPFLPKDLQTKEYISKIGRYVVTELIGYKNKDDILKLSQKDLNKFKISFSKTSYILNSPIKLIKICFPEIEFDDFEMKHSGNNYWKDYDNFIKAVKYYYYKIYKEENPNLSIDSIFNNEFIRSNFNKLGRAKEIHYNDLEWNSILIDAKIEELIPNNKKTASDGTKLESFEEKLIYEAIKYKLMVPNFHNNPLKNSIYRFKDDSNNKEYVPDYYIKSEDGVILIEYFGCWDSKTNKELYEGYREKMLNKINFYNSLDDFEFIYFLDEDIKFNFEGIKNKLEKVIRW